LSTVVCLALLAGVAVSANASQPGKWTQIAYFHNGAKSNLGLARDRHGVLHVLWAGPKRRSYTAIYDTPISLKGAVGQPKAVVSGWNSVEPPAAVATAGGAIHAVISGQKVNSNTDPFSGLNEAVGPGAWKLGPRAFGNFSITVSSSADVRTAALKSGQLVSIWSTAAALLFQTGVDPATVPQNVSPPGDPSGSPVIAVDQKSGDVVVAYHGVGSGSTFFRRILPTLSAPQAMPQSKADPSIASRAGGGVFSAYAPDAARVVLLQYGGKSRKVPVPKGARALTAGVAAGPDGRLWVFYGNEQTTYVTRTSKAVLGFEPVQTLKSPPKTVQYFRLEGEGSAGPLDLFADVTVDGQTKDGSYHTQVQPKLSLHAGKKTLKGGAVQVTVRVTDAGDPIQGSKVTGLPGGTKTTDAKGSVTVTVPAAKKGTVALVAKKPGYVAAKGRLTV
jgi:hypothetical protein